MLAHIWPTHHENVHFYGTHSVDIDGELAQLDADGYRPLRLPGVETSGTSVTGPFTRTTRPRGSYL